jgi:hypothetical protein
MKIKKFKFWYNWLLIVSVCNIVIGLLIAFFPNSFLFHYHTEAISETFFNGLLSNETLQLKAFFFGIIGGTISGYFLLQTLIVWISFYRKELWSWHAIFWAISLWFIVDSSLSFYHKAYFNILMINIWSFLLTVLPLIMTYKHFKK